MDFENSELAAGKKQKGYSLIEVLMAMTLLSMGLLAIGAMQIGAIKGNISARKASVANNLASSAMENVVNLPYNSPDLTLGVHTWEDANTSGGDFDVYWKVTEGPISATVNVQVVVRYEDKSETKYKVFDFIKSNDGIEDSGESSEEDEGEQTI